MALDPFPLQDTVDPEPVQPRFLDDDDRKDVPRPGACNLDLPPESGGMRSERHAATRIVSASMLARASAGVW